MMTGDTRRLCPTFSYALLKIGNAESKRRWATAEDLSAIEAMLRLDVLELVDWAVCDVDQGELERLVRSGIAGQDSRCSAYRRAALALWELMDGSRERTENEEQAVRWLLIERCHAAMWETPGIRELADDECERCLAPVDQPWAHDPGCTVCLKRFDLALWWGEDEEDGEDGAEEPLTQSA